jgi:hypothetical protein
MPKRFSRLKYAVKKLGATGGAAIEAFQRFERGESNYTTTPVDKGSEESVIIQPFGYSADRPVIVSYSGRAALNLTGAGLSAANLGHLAPDPDAGYQPGFIPAKAIVFVGTTGSGVATVSKITGLSYKKRGGASYTIPFGRVGATEGEFERQSAIVTAVESTPTRSVSFQSERIYRS